MTTDEIRKKYIEFFQGPPRNHKEIKPSPLILKDDETTLFTSAGMQPLVPFLSGKKVHPKGRRLVNSQPSFRAKDIEEVGDSRHTTFFEMLGNWSLGDYFKKEQIPWIWEFLTKRLGLPEEKLFVTIFEGGEGIGKDTESAAIWKDLGVPPERIFYYGAEYNWWSRAGSPDQMPEGEIGGPDTEVFFLFDSIKHNPKYGKDCHPNCECGRFLEIANSVFIEYEKTKQGKLKELPQKNVDFGGGLERLSAAVSNEPDIFKTDVFAPFIKKVETLTKKKYEENKSEMRIIADHMRGASYLIREGVIPSNKLHGYVLRRLIRRSALKLKILDEESSLSLLSFKKDKKEIEIIREEVGKFAMALDKGLAIFGKLDKDSLHEETAFDLFQSYGFPFELTQEIFSKKGKSLDKKKFDKIFADHKKLSKKESDSKFKGGLADTKESTVKLHTATHLLHWAIRELFGKSLRQEGSNITEERLRFDFSFDRKLKEEEIREIEEMINKKIEEDLPVTKSVEDKKEALAMGALSFFKEKYPEKVSIYTIGRDPKNDWISKEFCGGPHVATTKEIGRVKITKQKKIGSNLIRLYAELA